MKILVFGANGTIGTHAATELRRHHAAFCDGALEVIEAHRTSADFHVDANDDSSVKALFERVGEVDAVVSAIGNARWESADKATLDTYLSTIQGKLISQLRIALEARECLRPNGSITLTSGIVGNFAFPGGSASSVVNQALDAFVRTASPELPTLRINSVSATVIEESAAAYGATFPGFAPASGAAIGRAFVRSVFGVETGQTITAWG